MSIDQPSYLMIVQHGRLVPAGPLDEERLLTYANGTEVECVWKSVRNGKLIRQLYAVVGLAVKQCATPWQTADEAVQAMKSALGLVDYGKGMHGEQNRYLRSLNDVDEPELRDFMEGCWLILQKLTGVDPLTLRKEAGDTTSSSSPAGEAGHVPSGPPHEDDGGGGIEAGTDPTSPAADPSFPENQIDADAPEASDGRAHAAMEAEPTANPGSASTDIGAAASLGADASTEAEATAPRNSASDQSALRAEMIAKLFRLSSEAITVADRLAALATVRPVWEDKLDAETVRLAFDTIAKVVRGELPADAARKFLGGSP